MAAPNSDVLEGARATFDHYLAATKCFCRAIPRGDGKFLYPEDTIQADGAVFAAIFIWVWEAIREKEPFDQCYAEKKSAFDELARIVTPNSLNSTDPTRYVNFWNHNQPAAVADTAGSRSLCRTLRNGLGHFHSRYVNESPRAYFNKMGLTLPAHIPHPDVTENYRIFICDWSPGRKFMDSGSETRIVATDFAHFRYHLFMFLARFFSASGREPYVDILTRQPLK